MNTWTSCWRSCGAVLAAWCLATSGCRARDLTEGRYQGMIEYDQRDLAFEAAGRIVAVVAQRGQRVKVGDVIARQDDTLDRETRAIDARAVAVARSELQLLQAGARAEDIRAAEAELEAARVAERTAKTELRRDRTLVELSAAPAAQLGARRAELAAAVGVRKAQDQRLRAMRNGPRGEEIARATARLDQASEVLSLDDRRIERRTLVAPIEGGVLDLYIQAGELAAAGVAVAAIADVARPYADVFVPIAEVTRIVVGTKAALAVEGLADEVMGVVELVYPEAEFTPRFVFSPRERPNLMIRVRVRLDDRTGRLHAGLPVYAVFGTSPSLDRSRP